MEENFLWCKDRFYLLPLAQRPAFTIAASFNDFWMQKTTQNRVLFNRRVKVTANGSRFRPLSALKWKKTFKMPISSLKRMWLKLYFLSGNSFEFLNCYVRYAAFSWVCLRVLVSMLARTCMGTQKISNALIRYFLRLMI